VLPLQQVGLDVGERAWSGDAGWIQVSIIDCCRQEIRCRRRDLLSRNGKRVRVHLEIRRNVSSSGFRRCSIPLLGQVPYRYGVPEHADTQIQKEDRNQDRTDSGESHQFNNKARRKSLHPAIAVQLNW
jgi:hypothetical protein